MGRLALRVPWATPEAACAKSLSWRAPRMPPAAMAANAVFAEMVRAAAVLASCGIAPRRMVPQFLALVNADVPFACRMRLAVPLAPAPRHGSHRAR